MLNVLVRIARYVILVFVAAYTALDGYYITRKSEKRKRAVLSAMYFLLYSLHGFMSIILYANFADSNYMIFYALTVVVFVLYQYVYTSVYRRTNRHLLCNVLFLVMLGLVLQARLSINKAYKQLLLLMFAGIVTMVVPKILDNARKYLYRYTWFYGIGGLAAITAIAVGGRTEYGAKLSFGFAGFSVQPSEIVKITLVLFVAGMFHRSVEFRQLVITTLVAAAHVLVLLLSKDLGTALIYFLAYVFMLFVATERYRYLFLGMGAGALAAVASYYLFYHVRVRVQIWLDPWSSITGNGLQIAQSLFGIGTGGLFGMGFTGGTPYSIPVAIKDFIFAALCEELGVLVGVCVLIIFLIILLHFLSIATTMQLMFYKITAFGLACLFGFQILVNVAGVIKMVPLTGITLPFISYGGSSLLSTFFMFGMFQGMYMNIQRDEENEARRVAELEARRHAREQAANKARMRLEGWKNE